MRSHRIVAAGAVALATGCAPATVPPIQPSVPTPTSSPERLQIAGIPVLFKPVQGNDIIALRLYVRGGSASLRPDVSGIERLLISAARRGTAKYDKDQFAQLATRTGASFGGTAEFDYSVFTGQGVRQHWNELWDLFTQAALHPTFPAAEVEVVRGQILNALRQIPDDPDEYLSFLADSIIYLDHPYAVRPGGTVQAVTSITRDALAAWHRERLTKENLLLVVVGNLSRAELEEKVTAAFDNLPVSGSAAATVSPLRELQRDAVVVSRELPTTYIAGYYAAPPPSHADYAPFVVTTDILSDRLWEEVRTKRNLSYAPYASLLTRRANVGYVYVTTVSPDSALRVMLDEVHRMQREAIPADRLAEAVNVRVTVHWLRNETNMNQAAQLGFWELNGGGWENAALHPERIRAVTAADVQRVADRYLRNARFVVIGAADHVNRQLFGEL